LLQRVYKLYSFFLPTFDQYFMCLDNDCAQSVQPYFTLNGVTFVTIPSSRIIHVH